MNERKLFHAAVQLARSGDRERAYQLMCQALIEEPTYVPAWLWMSGLVTEVARQRECLERALALDPSCIAAKKGLELLQQQAVPPTSVPPQNVPGSGHIGDYLIARGTITPEQLEQALSEHRRSQTRGGEAVPLGEILIRRGWLTPPLLAAALVQQAQDRLVGGTPQQWRLGEHLLQSGEMTADRLVTALTEQITRQMKGEQILLGELLTRDGYVTVEAVTQALQRQIEALFSGSKWEEVE